MIHIGPPGDIPPPRHSKVLVSLAIGDEYISVWNTACRRSWELYAERHGYDLVVLTQPIDPPDCQRRSPAWQKCLILELPRLAAYERAVWIDADIVANPDAPDIIAEVPADKVGATLVNDQLGPVDLQIFIERRIGRRAPLPMVGQVWAAMQNAVYLENGVQTDAGVMIATGVMVLTPALHRDALFAAYAAEERGRAYEQPHLSHLLLQRGLFHPISPRWNWGLYDALHVHHADQGNAPMQLDYFQTVVRSELRNAFFLHFYMVFDLLRSAARTGWSPV